MGLNGRVFPIYFMSNTKTQNISMRKKIKDKLLHGQMKLDLKRFPPILCPWSLIVYISSNDFNSNTDRWHRKSVVGLISVLKK